MVTTSMPGAYHLLQMRLVQTDITVNLVTSDCYIFFSKLVHHIYKHQAPIGSKKKKKTVPIQVSTGPEGPTGFHEVKIPRFRENGTGWL